MKALSEKEWTELQEHCEKEDRKNKVLRVGIYCAVLTIKTEVGKKNEKFT